MQTPPHEPTQADDKVYKQAATAFADGLVDLGRFNSRFTAQYRQAWVLVMHIFRHKSRLGSSAPDANGKPPGTLRTLTCRSTPDEVQAAVQALTDLYIKYDTVLGGGLGELKLVVEECKRQLRAPRQPPSPPKAAIQPMDF